ncbi:hypothetical protein M0802_011924 [Mischocyttarus mexicanus]|nr:hypothetical protein M0802_011924 [Mischocyttarus mexicanus]
MFRDDIVGSLTIRVFPLVIRNRRCSAFWSICYGIFLDYEETSCTGTISTRRSRYGRARRASTMDPSNAILSTLDGLGIRSGMRRASICLQSNSNGSEIRLGRWWWWCWCWYWELGRIVLRPYEYGFQT